MSKFIIAQDFWDMFPQADLAVITIRGIDNSEEGSKSVRPEIIKLLEDSNKNAVKFLTAEVLSDNKVISVWRDAFKKFKTKKGVRCSIEALLKRVDKGTGVGPINPLVDIYNSVSLTYGLPCGGEDLDTFVGNMVLTKAEGNEQFLALGDEEPENALPNELVYKDDAGIVCRCWNWRDGQRTMLTENTKNAFLMIESVDPSKKQDMISAAEELAKLAERFIGGRAKVTYLNINNRELEL